MSIQAFIDHLAHEKKYAQHTITAYKRDLERFAAYCASEHQSVQLEDVAYTLIRSWIVTLVDQGLEHRSINRKISSLRSYYKFLYQIGQIDQHPLRNHKPLKAPKNVQIPLSEEEMLKLWDGSVFTEDYNGVLGKTIIELLDSTGMRRSELIHLKPENIDWDNHKIKVLGKRNKERYLPLLPALKETLKAYEKIKIEKGWASQPYFLLGSKGKKLTENFVYTTVNFYLKQVSTKKKVSPHMIRHSFATHLLNNGAELKVVQDLLGHTSLAATQVYTHSSMQKIKAAYAKAHPRGGTKKNV